MRYLLIIILLLFNYSCSNNEKVKKPNIIYILADDLGYGDLSEINNLSNKHPEIVKDLIIEMNSIKKKSFQLNP